MLSTLRINIAEGKEKDGLKRGEGASNEKLQSSCVRAMEKDKKKAEWLQLALSSYNLPLHKTQFLHKLCQGCRLSILKKCLNCSFLILPLSKYVRVLNTFYYQLIHTTLKSVELLKHSKIDKNAPTCFGLHGNHLQGAKISTWLKVTRLVNSRCVKDVQGVVSAMAAYCDL